MKMKKTWILLLGLVLSAALHGQQRPLTATYMYNGLLLNPAYAGSLNLLSVTAVHRKQWINVPGAPQYTSLSANNSFMGNRIGLGFYAQNDQIGIHSDNSLYLSYAYKISTAFGILSMGLSGGFNDRISDPSKLNLLDKNDPYLSLLAGQTYIKNFAPNFGTGVYFANPKFYAGFSIPYIVENTTLEVSETIAINSEASRESRYYYFTSGIIFPIGHSTKLSPSILLRAQEEARPTYDISTTVIFDNIAYVGVSVRNSGELTFMGQIILNENMRVGYAYDAITNAQKSGSAGSHEILLNYRIKLKNYKHNPQCPSYF